ncbi:MULTISPECIES: GntR family transcriptional regulator [unclassified Pseudactinotalea]|uniref:GntR family transcriptional regulator n=1 Tax=unclassified Pseudactinotalea TaxID=2649176 RepID=UPI0018839EDC|nr:MULTISPECIES: GntR family transcriptional regulator [unclassified Pseudactinotalea]
MSVSSSRTAAPVSVFRVPRTSTVDLIATELRNAIFSGALAVGTPIREVEISRQLGVSRSPLREATQRLLQEGVLTATPGRGLRVSKIGPDHLPDLYSARDAIESRAIRMIVDARDTDAIAALEASYDLLVAASAGTDARSIGDADLAFHQTLVDGAGSRRLSHYMATLALETRIASLSVPEGYAVRRTVSSTYEELLTALRGWDADRASAALREQFAAAIARLTGHAASVETVESSPEEETPTVGPLGAH